MDGTWGSAGLSDSDLNTLQRHVSCIVCVSGRRCKGCGSFLRQENGGKVCAPCGEKGHWALVNAMKRLPHYAKARTLEPEVAEKFWELCRNGFVRKCWGWRGGTNLSGLPIFYVDTKLFQARRVSFALRHGEISYGKYILARCGRRLCTNPRHLYASRGNRQYAKG